METIFPLLFSGKVIVFVILFGLFRQLEVVAHCLQMLPCSIVSVFRTYDFRKLHRKIMDKRKTLP